MTYNEYSCTQQNPPSVSFSDDPGTPYYMKQISADKYNSWGQIVIENPQTYCLSPIVNGHASSTSTSTATSTCPNPLTCGHSQNNPNATICFDESSNHIIMYPVKPGINGLDGCREA